MPVHRLADAASRRATSPLTATLPLVCPRCNGAHLVKECELPMVCRLCTGEGHMAKECPKAVCKNCQQEGKRLVGLHPYPP